MRKTLAVSERRACRVLGQVRRTQRYTPRMADDEVLLTTSTVSLASAYGRYGYRRITALLRTDGWRREYNQVRPHSALGYKPPAPEAVSGPLSATAS